uniref:TOG domain-containing protein n=2 Tax=Schistocephalus solidus TaxID=70667 RepID=A0A0X3NYS1_SCHSO
MAEELEWKKLPTIEKVEHKQWKARVEGYEEAVKLFSTQPSDKSPVFSDYVGLMKKMVVDNNAIAQEKALFAVLAFAENAAIATRVASDVCSGIVNKCLNSTRAKTKETGIEILFLYIEREKGDVVVEELLKGLSAKQPKIVIGCVQALKEALSLFGSKVVSIKSILKEIIRLLEDRDGTVRNESKELIIEMYRWAGPAIKPQLSGLKPVQITELEAEFAKLPTAKPVPTRYLISQKPKEDPRAAETTSGKAPQELEDNEPQLDAYALADAVNILSKIPNDYWEKIEDKKWQERKEALTLVEQLTDVIKLDNGDYSALLNSLIKVISKDTNILLVGQSAKIVAQIANALRAGFKPYAVTTIKACFEKFKEKKPTVLVAIRAAADAAQRSVTLESLQEDIIEALNNKNPGIRAETALFLSRIFAKMTIVTLNKKLLKTFVVPLLKCSADMVLEVREAAFCALGTAMFIVTEKNISPFLADIDNIRLNRIKEFYEKVANEKKGGSSDNEGKGAPSSLEAASVAPSKPNFKVIKGNKPAGVAVGEGKTVSVSPGEDAPRPTKPSAAKKKAQPAAPASDALPKEQLWSDDVLEAKIAEAYSETLIAQLASSVWKERLEAMETLRSSIDKMAPEQLSCQLVFRLLLKKPGLKDNNFQVLRMKIELVSEVLQLKKPCSEVIVDLLLPDLTEKVGDIKVGEAVKLAFTALAEATTFEIVGGRILRAVYQQKNPKCQIECLNWLSLSIKEFGLQLNTKELLVCLKTGLGATNLQVRQACIYLSSVMYLYMGGTLRTLLSDEKPALVALLEEEWSKLGDSKPPAPTRGLRYVKQQQSTASDGASAEGAAAAEPEVPDPEDLVPRTDISEKLTEEMMNLLVSKAWKERQEGLNQIQEVLTSAQFIEGGPKLQDPLTAVAKVCTDVNKILGKNALGIVEKFAKALSKSDAKKLVKCVQPFVLMCFGDSKPQVREAAVSALSAWRERSGLAPMTENETFTEALKPENPFLRAELLGWLAVAMEDLRAGTPAVAALGPDFRDQIIGAILPVCEDRNPEARSRAQKMLPVLIRAFGPEAVHRCTKRLKPTTMEAVQPLVEKAKEAVAAERAASGAAEASVAPKAIRGGGGGGAAAAPKDKDSTAVPEPTPQPSTGAVASGDVANDEEPSTVSQSETSTAKSSKKAGSGSKKPAVTSKRAAALEQAEEAASMVPLQVNKLRETRMQDEKKRKLLKWDFDAPSRDHVQQLNQLFLAAGASPDLHSCLFHTDFKQHIRALETLTRLLDGAWTAVDGEAATRANLDLILRWIVLRFFETNPAVLARCLEYILKVFGRLSESEANLTEYEATAFLPYLVMKVGDPKDNIRRDIRAIFRIVVTIFPPARFYPFLVNGLKSKVNKARQECLEEIGCMIEQFGLNVCQPSPAASLKVLAGQISDRDSGVRTAALNSLVAAYAIVGEALWKMLGELPEKDRSMLEERIKRAGRPSTAASNTTSKRSASERPPGGRRETADLRQTNGHVPQGQQPYLDALRPAAGTNQPASVHSIAYAKAQNLLSELGDLNPEHAAEIPNLLEFDKDINEIFKPFEVPELKCIAKTRTTQPALNVLLRTSPDAASAITMVVTQISSNDPNIACYALAQIDALIQSDKWQLLMGHTNQIIMLITIQLRQINTRFFDDPSISANHLVCLLRSLLVVMQSLFKRSLLARECSRESLKEFIYAVLHVMVHEKTAELPEGGSIIRVINALTLSIIDESNSTRVLSAFIRLLHESVSSGHFSNRFTQVVMRSLWRITKGLSENGNKYAFDVILIDCHNFLKAFPSPSWKTRKSDVPLRTIKTMLHTFCVVRGPGILKYVDSIPNKEDSELESYLIRTLKSLSNSGTRLPPALQPTLKNPSSPIKTAVLSPENHQKVASLVQRIASTRDDATGAIEDLFDITSALPDLDLEPFLANYSSFARTYVRQALYNVGLLRSQRGTAAYSNGTPLKPITSELPRPGDDLSHQAANPKLFMDRLASLRRQIGLETTTSNLSDGLSDDPGIGGEGRASSGSAVNNAVLEATLRGIVQPPNEDAVNAASPTTQTESTRQPGMSQNELAEIKRRLALIKNAQMRGT